jgi:hypothetical protein
MNDQYNQAMRIFTDAMHAANAAQIHKIYLIRALADFTAAVSLMAAGTPCLDIVIHRMGERVEDFRAAKFPPPDQRFEFPVISLSASLDPGSAI